MSVAPQSIWCVVPAAGRGRRFGGDVPKQYQSFGAAPLLLVTLRRLALHPSIAGLMVVLAQDDAHWPKLGQLNGKPVLTAEGGDERADSVLSGLRALRDSGAVGRDDWLLVHDAARPCFAYADIDRLIELGSQHPYGALLACPISDSLKRVVGERMLESHGAVSRDQLWRAQTPQMFRLTPLIENLMSALDASTPDDRVTDEASAYEHHGCFPLVVQGSASNIKVTTTDDLHMALRLVAD
ncbi:MAG: 2-C-methyl-D-erythritol 4-phosphate cytidylyltransferase [Lysobacterales bacterium]